ncbi:MAG TPA: S8 family peptidase, partial [Pyrinomonadaceae bacterium]
MKRLAALLLIIGVCALALIPTRTHAQRPDAPAGKLRRNVAAIKNHYLVVLHESVGRAQVGEVAGNLSRLHGGTIGYTYRNALRGFSVEMNEAQATALSRHPQVAFVEEDAEVEGASTQTSAPWQLDRLDQRNPAPTNSYTYESDGKGVNAYVIDGGIRYTHQEFGGRAAFAYDYLAGGTGLDCNGHGTHVAGLIGGNTYGVAKGAKLWSVRVLDCANQGTIARIVAGVDWVAGNHVKPAVANLSFITVVANTLNGTMDIAVKNLIAAGVTTVVAAGNNTGDASSRTPARVPEAITVAATDPSDNRASFSNFGAVVDVFAPGVDITSAHSTGDTDTFVRSGTSSAAPIVAGIAARYLGTRPGDAPDAVSQAITTDASVGKVINPGSETTPNRLAYTGITVSDDFNDNSINTAKWNVGDAAGGIVAEQNGRLEVTPPASTTGYNGYYSATTADLTDSRTSVEVTPGNAAAYGAETYFMYAEGNNYVLFATGGSNILFQTAVNGVMSRTYVPYSATQHRFWRFRHNRPTDQISWETSPDGVTWNVQRTVARQFSITNLQLSLQAGKYTAAATGGTTIYDNLWHESNPTPPVVMADNFDDNSINPAMWDTPDPVSPTTVSELNGRIEVALQPN